MANRLSKVVKKSGTKQKPIPVKIVYDEPKAAVDSTNSDRRWKAESALRTLAEADRIRKDRGLMKEVKSVAKEQIKQMSGVLK